MRVVVATAIVCLAALAVAATPNPQPAADKALTVILLGTVGGPTFNPERLGISTMVVAGSERLLFDAGRGLSTGLAKDSVSTPPM